MLDLTKILKVGEKVYSLVHNKIMKVSEIDPQQEFPIKIGSGKGSYSYNKHGSILKNGKDCLLFPSESETTWDNFSPFKKGEIVVVSNNIQNSASMTDQYPKVRVFKEKRNGMYIVFDGKDSEQEFEICEYLIL